MRKPHPWRSLDPSPESVARQAAWRNVSVLPAEEPPSEREISDIARSLPAYEVMNHRSHTGSHDDIGY